MPFGPGLAFSALCVAGYGYWRFTFRPVTAAMRLEQAGKIDEARALLRQFLSNRNPLTERGEAKARCRLLLARLERRAGRYDQAVAETADLLNRRCSPGIALAALQVQADALAWAGAYDDSIAALDRALEQASSPRLRSVAMEIRGMQARTSIWQGKLDRARELLEPLHATQGSACWFAHLRMVDIHRAMGEYEGALDWAQRLSRALATAPAAGNPREARLETWAALARLFGARAAWLAGALEIADEWLSDPDTVGFLPPPEVFAWTGLQALAAAREGDRPLRSERETALRQAADRTSAGFGAHSWRWYYEGHLALFDGNNRGAAELTARAIRSNPPGEALAEMFFYLGQALERAGDPGTLGAYTCGSRQPDLFHFSQLCRERAAALSPESSRNPGL